MMNLLNLKVEKIVLKFWKIPKNNVFLPEITKDMENDENTIRLPHFGSGHLLYRM